MAGFGHSNLANLGYSLRPYLNPSAVEEEKKKSSSKSTKPAWQRELIQSAALMATKAKQDKAEYSIRKTASQQEELDREAALKANIAQTQEVNPDQMKGGLDSSLADAEGRALHPTRGRGGHLDAMPEDYKQAQAATWLNRGTDTKLGDILGDTYRGELESDAESAKNKLAGEIMQRQNDIANTEKTQLALQEKKNTIARSLQDWEYKQAKQIAKEKADLAKEVLAKQEKFDKSQEDDIAADKKENIRITALQRKTSLENLKLAREAGERRAKAEAAKAKIDIAATKAEDKAEADKGALLDKEIAKIHALNPRRRGDLTAPTQKMMANQIFGEDGMSGSFRTGFNTIDRIDPSAPTTQKPGFSLKRALMSLGGGALDAPDIPIPEAERDRLPTATDEDWTSMLTMQERNVILDQLWKQAVSIANSKGTSAQNEFNLLSLAVSEGKVSPYDYMPGSPKTGMVEATSPDIQVRSASDLLAALQAGDSLDNKVYEVDGVGAFKWDNATQKFVKIQ